MKLFFGNISKPFLKIFQKLMIQFTPLVTGSRRSNVLKVETFINVHLYLLENRTCAVNTEMQVEFYFQFAFQREFNMVTSIDYV